jgi:16S rRNA (guanine966-N2)-methyltransferase
MRIVAGERKGMRLDAPTGRGTRPTSDRLRETLFSVLGDVGGLHVLDAFAGSGALGLEALSRGAAHAELWETSPAALRVLRGNVERLGYGDRARVRRRDARRAMAQDVAVRVTYELILLDPPYTMLAALQQEFSLHLPQLLVPGGLAVIESDGASPPPALALPLAVDTTRVQGAARLTVYRRA